jgi:hypothetical protein
MFTGIGATPVPSRTLTYGSADGVNLTLDLYPARQPGPRPCVIVVMADHGPAVTADNYRS